MLPVDCLFLLMAVWESRAQRGISDTLFGYGHMVMAILET